MNPTMTSQKKAGILCCVTGATCWGISGACSEALFRLTPVDTTWVTAVRMLVSGILLMAYAIAKRKTDISAILKDQESCLQILLFSLAGLALCQYSYLSAIKWTNSGTATVLQNLSIVFISVYICLTTRKFPEKKTVVSIFLALFGVWLIATGGVPGNLEITPKGLFWGLAAGMSAAGYSLLSRKPVSKWGSIPVTGMGMLIGGGFLFAAARAWQIPSGLNAEAFFLLSAIILIGTVGAFSLFMEGIQLIGPVRASLIACLEPLTATALSAFWLHSGFSSADLAGFACILVTVFLST